MRSGNLLNCIRFQFISSEDFCLLPFLTASGAQEKGTVLPPSGSVADPASAPPVIGKRETIVPDCHVRCLSKERLADGSSTRISPSGYAFGL